MRCCALKECNGKRYTQLLFQLTHFNLLVITVCRCSCVMAQIPTFMVCAADEATLPLFRRQVPVPGHYWDDEAGDENAYLSHN